MTSKITSAKLDNAKKTLSLKRNRRLSQETLPIAAHRIELIEKIDTNPTTIIVGETGCGKSTQLPQYLSDYYKNDCIVCTQPRRVAAVTIAGRVAEEQSCKIGDKVGYTIRFDDRTSYKTKIKYVTDGILLREMMNDHNLSKYKVVILDEAHERSLQTDILMGLLRTLQNRREDLRIVIMSATLETDLFLTYFKNPSLIYVKGRQYPVQVMYTVKPQPNYIDAALQTCLQIHEEQEAGGVLVFLPGQDDIESLQLLLEEHLPVVDARKRKKDSSESPMDGTVIQTRPITNASSSSSSSNATITEASDSTPSSASTGMTGTARILPEQRGFEIRPLYAALPPEKQLEALRPATATTTTVFHHDSNSSSINNSNSNKRLKTNNDNSSDHTIAPTLEILPQDTNGTVTSKPTEAVRTRRRFILSTNVAETSVTVHDIKYVVDCGYAKMRLLQGQSGLEMLKVMPVSVSQANQRAGRAGRESSGICFRLYQERTFETLSLSNLPEMERVHLGHTLLLLLGLGIPGIDPVSFPYPSPPTPEALQIGLRQLAALGAIDTKKDSSEESVSATSQGSSSSSRQNMSTSPSPTATSHQSSEIKSKPSYRIVLTAIGKRMADLPLEPQLALLLLKSEDFGCVDEALTIVSLLSADTKSLFLQPQKEQEKRAAHTVHRRFFSLHGDLPGLLRVWDAWSKSPKNKQWASENYLSFRTLQHAASVKTQLWAILRSKKYPKDPQPQTPPPPPACSPEIEPFLRCLASALFLNTARREETVHKGNNFRSTGSGSMENNSYQAVAPYKTMTGGQLVFLHPSCMLSSLNNRSKLPLYVIYAELLVTTKTYIHNVTGVEAAWLTESNPTLFKTNR